MTPTGLACSSLLARHMNDDAMTTSANRRQLSAQQRAVEQLRAVAKPYRFRVQADAEGFPFIPGRYGRMEWYCDGVNCSSCALPGQLALAVYTDRPRLFEKLWAIPGVRRHQTGDAEMRAVFPVEALAQVAAVIGARQRRTQTSPRSLQNLRSRIASRSQEPLSGDGKGLGPGSRAQLEKSAGK